MSRKAFEVTFKIGGSLAGSFASAFSTAGNRLEKVKRQTKELKSSLKELDKAYKTGAINSEQYERAQEKLTRIMERNAQRQKRVIESQQRAIQMGNDFNNARQNVATKAMVTTAIAGATTAGLAFNSVGKAMNFESQLSSIQAVTGITNEQLYKVREVSLEQGAATKYSALEAAQGFEELLKAGVSLETALGDGLSSSLNLATAGGLELAEAAEILSDGLNGFRKDGMSAADVANILAGAANASSTGVREMKFGLSAVGPVADGIGVSFKEVNATLASFSNNALKGSDAGTSLKTFLANVVPKTNDAIALFKKFGLLTDDNTNIFFEANGELKDMAEVADILKIKFKNLTAEKRSEVFYDLFGSDAIRAANILYKEGATGIEKMYQEMSKVTALDVAKQKMDNAAGAVEQLKGAFETMQIIGAEALNPLIKASALNLAETFERNAPDVEKFGLNLADNLEDVFNPFLTVKPEFDQNYSGNPEYMEYYQKELEKWEKFKGMDFSDKAIYSLDTMTEKTEEWVNGEGGEDFERIFTKLAEISMKAYANALTKTATGSLSNLAQGNVAAAGGLGTIAWLMGGGFIAKSLFNMGKGAWGLGKGGIDLLKNKADDKALKTLSKGPETSSNTAKSNTITKGTKNNLIKFPEKSSNTAKALTTISKHSSNALKVVGKVASKAALPATIALEAFNVVKAKDKVKATGEAAGGIGGGIGGAKVGAIIGSAIAPGVGTAIGGILGGLGGYFAGKWLGGKTVDGIRNNDVEKKPQANIATSSTQDQTTAALSISMQKSIKNLDLFTMYTGRSTGVFAGSMLDLSNSIRLAKNNMSLLYSYVGQASGWIATISTIQTSATSVNTALNSLATKIDNISTPTILSTKSKGAIGIGGSKIGAIISNAIAPGLGTIIRGALDGFGDKTVDVKNRREEKNQQINNMPSTQEQQITALTVSIRKSIQNLDLFTMYTGRSTGVFAGGMLDLSNSIRLAKNNMSLLYSYIGQASGWIATISTIQTSATSVNTALNSLATKIDNIRSTTPTTLSAKSTQITPVRIKKFARGDIVNQATPGIFGEAGPEALIPIDGSNRAKSLWEKTGQLLGMNTSQNGASNINITYAPVIHSNESSEVKRILENDKNNFKNEMNKYMQQQARLSF